MPPMFSTTTSVTRSATTRLQGDSGNNTWRKAEDGREDEQNGTIFNTNHPSHHRRGQSRASPTAS
jgi:hypothetical protein